MKTFVKTTLFSSILLITTISHAYPDYAKKTDEPSQTRADNPHKSQAPAEMADDIVPILPKYPLLREDGILDNYAYLSDKENEKLFLTTVNDENRYALGQIDKSLQERLENEMLQRSQTRTEPQIWQENGVFFKKSYDKNSHAYQYFYKTDNDWQAINTPKTTTTNPSFNSAKTMFAIASDPTGEENFRIDIQDLSNQKSLAKIDNTNGDFVWLDDNRLIYIHNQNGNADKIYLHEIGKDNDKLIFDKVKQGFYIGLTNSSSDKYIIMTINNLDSSEIYLIDKTAENPQPILVKALKTKQEYYLDHIDNKFVIRSNHQHKNFALYQANSLKNLQNNHWQKIFTPKADETFESFLLQGDWQILKVRKQGLSQIYYQSSQKPLQAVKFFDDAYMMWLSASGFDNHLTINNDILNIAYTSPTTAKTLLSYDLANNRWLKMPEKQADYQVKRLFIKSLDGSKIPVSLVYKASLWQKGKSPLLVYGYGSYGQSMDMTYGSSYFSLLDKGFVYAIIHVRGGGELGERWHTGGKNLNKINSINDFVSVTKALQNLGFGNKQKTFAMGESAGGWLVANACIKNPTLYQGCVLQVPFVDLLSALGDDSQSAKAEFDEWGNPHIAKEFANLKKISPYEIITPQNYPKFLLIANLNDVRTDARHALKFVAKLRDNQLNNDNPIVLYTHLEGGHGGAFGQFSRIKNNALAYSFLLKDK